MCAVRANKCATAEGTGALEACRGRAPRTVRLLGAARVAILLAARAAQRALLRHVTLQRRLLVLLLFLELLLVFSAVLVAVLAVLAVLGDLSVGRALFALLAVRSLRGAREPSRRHEPGLGRQLRAAAHAPARLRRPARLLARRPCA